MKKLLALTAVLIAMSTVAIAAEHSRSLTAHSKPVRMTVVIPEYIGLTAVSTLPIKFSFKGQQEQISEGYHHITAQSLTAPSWTLNYNLKSRTVSVIAYASDLRGDVKDVIPAANIAGQSLQNNLNWQWFDSYAPGTMGQHAMLLDTFKTTKGNGSSLNNGGDKTEGFSVLSIDVANFGAPGGLIPTPDTYHGFLYIVAQAI